MGETFARTLLNQLERKADVSFEVLHKALKERLMVWLLQETVCAQAGAARSSDATLQISAGQRMVVAFLKMCF